MLFGANSQCCQALNDIISNPNVTVDEIIECQGVIPQFRNNHKELVEFLTRYENVKRLIEILRSDNNKRKHEIILKLFQSGNTSLHRVFADNLLLTEYAISVIDCTNENYNCYAVGIIFRLISRAFELWYDDMSEIFRLSDTIYRTIIIHFNNFCVFHSIKEIVKSSSKNIWLFMWYLFIALVGKDKDQYSLPRKKAIIKDITIDPALITKEHRTNILIILKSFLRLKLPQYEDFVVNLEKYVATKELDAELINFAISFPENEEITKRVLEIISKTKDYSSTIIQKSLEYLTYSEKFVSVETTIKLIVSMILNETTSNIALHFLSELLKCKLKDFKLEEIEELKQILGYLFNKFKDDNISMHLFYVYNISSIINAKESEEGQWKDYIKFVVKNIKQDMDIDESFSFDSNIYKIPNKYI